MTAIIMIVRMMTAEKTDPLDPLLNEIAGRIYEIGNPSVLYFSSNSFIWTNSMEIQVDRQRWGYLIRDLQ